MWLPNARTKASLLLVLSALVPEVPPPTGLSELLIERTSVDRFSLFRSLDELQSFGCTSRARVSQEAVRGVLEAGLHKATPNLEPGVGSLYRSPKRFLF